MNTHRRIVLILGCVLCFSTSAKESLNTPKDTPKNGNVCTEEGSQNDVRETVRLVCVDGKWRKVIHK